MISSQTLKQTVNQSYDLLYLNYGKSLIVHNNLWYLFKEGF